MHIYYINESNISYLSSYLLYQWYSFRLFAFLLKSGSVLVTLICMYYISFVKCPCIEFHVFFEGKAYQRFFIIGYVIIFWNLLMLMWLHWIFFINQTQKIIYLSKDEIHAIFFSFLKLTDFLRKKFSKKFISTEKSKTLI